MTNKLVYLKPDVTAEALINQWYAWSYLISPATAPFYLANYQLPIMESFVSAPAVHESAVKNPAMVGGPFVNFAVSKVAQTSALLQQTRKEQAHLLEFARAVKALDELLASEADGSSLEPLYDKIPAILQGYVELHYDLHNNASFRFLEALLYRSRFYDESRQSIALTPDGNDNRPFVFSTPRLKDDGSLHLATPFRAAAVDELFKMRNHPQTLNHIEGYFDMGDEQRRLFRSLFSERQPRQSPRYDGDGMRIRYFGHATLLIESRSVSILTDPLISYDYAAAVDRYTYGDLPPRIDFVVITHSHQDHCVFEELLQLRHRIGTVIVPRSTGGGRADPSLRLLFKNIGFPNVVEMDELDTLDIDGGSITGLPFLGEHCDLNIRSKTSYLVRLQGRSVLVGADSCNIVSSLYDQIHEIIGRLDALFLGMECDGAPLSWLYGPLLTKPMPRKLDQSRKLNGSDYRQAIDMVARLQPEKVYIYAMGLEPWSSYITSLAYSDEDPPIVESNKLLAECRRRSLPAERLVHEKEILLGPRTHGVRSALRQTETVTCT